MLLLGDFVAAQLDIDYLERLHPSTNNEVRSLLISPVTVYKMYLFRQKLWLVNHSTLNLIPWLELSQYIIQLKELDSLNKLTWPIKIYQSMFILSSYMNAFTKASCKNMCMVHTDI